MTIVNSRMTFVNEFSPSAGKLSTGTKGSLSCSQLSLWILNLGVRKTGEGKPAKRQEFGDGNGALALLIQPALAFRGQRTVRTCWPQRC
jgi:hypothetical protein